MNKEDKDSQSSVKSSAKGSEQNIWREDHEAMPGALQTRLSRLCERAGVEFDPTWDESQALEKVKELEAQLGPDE